MRLGGPIFEEYSNPEEWVALVKKHGYKAAYCPVKSDASESVIKEYARAAKEADIFIAEVGAWSNLLHSDEVTRNSSMDYCIKQLELAEKLEACCCVNIAGSRGKLFDGPHPDNLTDETFEMIVDITQNIIDSVKPERTYFTLEFMPWIYPDSPDSYVKLIHAINRKHFAVHLDPVNIINCPERYFKNSNVIKECFSKLGPYIKSCHAKDITMSDKLTVHLQEVAPGKGILNYKTYLAELQRLNPDIPLMLEHLQSSEEYDEAAHFVRSTSEQININL